MLKIVKIKLISFYHNDLLLGYFDIKNTSKFIAIKYYLKKTLCHNVKNYIKKFDICFILKLVRYKLYNNL